MCKVGVNIYKRKDGRWEGRFVKGRKNGRAIYGSVFGKSLGEVNDKLTKAKYEWNSGLVNAKLNKSKLLTLAEEWLEESKAFLKESTVVRYGDYLYKYICPQFGAFDMSEIDDWTLTSFCLRLIKEGGANKQGLSSKTVSEIIQVMKQLRKYAKVRNIDVGYTADSIRIKQKPKSLRIFTKSELRKLRAYLKKNECISHFGILICLSTGIRIGELCALTWDDISLDEKKLYVRHTLQRIKNKSEKGAKSKIIITPPKSDCSIRTIPLPDKLCSALALFRQPGAVFLTGEKEKFMEPRTMQNHFKTALIGAGIDDANFHALRHTFATLCIEAGVDPKCLSELLGHSNVSITLNRYVHPSMELKRKSIKKLKI